MSTAAPILCINSGSSSLKFALYRMEDGQEEAIGRGAVEELGSANSRIWLQAGAEVVRAPAQPVLNHHEAIGAMFALFATRQIGSPRAVGHRLVSGGPHHVRHTRIDAAFLRDIRRAVQFAPLHLPAAIDAIEAVGRHYPHLPQVACMDTAFHADLPEIAARLPLPRYLWDEGVRKYGFHGLSYEYILGTLPAEEQRKRLIIAHLGNGASMAAIAFGKPVDTTMGLTPAGGFMMGTRSGDLDPGVLLYLLGHKTYTHQTIQDLVNHRSGLLGVSGDTADMRLLLRDRATNAHAAQAIDMFCYQIRKAAGALAAAMDGLDTLVFTGGIGEHAQPVRALVAGGLGCLGVRLDHKANARDADIISTQDSRVRIRVIPTHEDLVIARHTQRILQTA